MNLKKVLNVIAGSLIMGIGISLIIATNLGSDPMTMFWIGISKTLNITIGQANLFVSAVLLTYVFLTDRKQIHLGSLLNPIVISLTTDVLYSLDFQHFSYPLRIGILIAGLLMLAFGIAYYALADYGKGAYEAFIFTIKNKTKWSIGIVRTSADILFALLGVMLGAIFSLGSLLAILFMGTSIQMWIHFLESNIKHVSGKE